MIADNAAATTVTDGAVYTSLDHANSTTAETVADFGDKADVAAFIAAQFSDEATDDNFIFIINDTVGEDAYIYSVDFNSGNSGAGLIDADKAQIDAAVRCGAPAIEIHTGAYADAETTQQQLAELEILKDGIAYALAQGLIVNAGHGLHYHNVEAIAAIPGINELNIDTPNLND